jgi:hypothetical protein
MSAAHVKAGKPSAHSQKVESSIHLLQVARQVFVLEEDLTDLIPSGMRLAPCGNLSLLKREYYRFFIPKALTNNDASHCLVNL